MPNTVRLLLLQLPFSSCSTFIALVAPCPNFCATFIDYDVPSIVDCFAFSNCFFFPFFKHRPSLML
jgi:hypothetical protein